MICSSQIHCTCRNNKTTHKTWHIRIKIVSNDCSRISFKDTRREKAPTNKTTALLESMIMDIWVVGTSNQLLLTGPYTETKFSKKKKVTAKLHSLWLVHFVLPILFVLTFVLSVRCYPFNHSTFNYKTSLVF